MRRDAAASAARGVVAPRAPSDRLPRQVKLFGVLSLFNDFASEMIYPLLPAFVTGVLGGGAQALGALDGAAGIGARLNPSHPSGAPTVSCEKKKSERQSPVHLVCCRLLEKTNNRPR